MDGMLYAIIAVYFWSLAYIFIDILGNYFNIFFLNFIRSLFALLISLLLFRRLPKKKILKYSYIPLLDSLAQILFVVSIFILGPVIVSFLVRPLIALETFFLSIFIFVDERRRLLRWDVLLGVFFVILGSLLIMYPGKLEFTLKAIFLILFLTLLRSLYSSLVKIQLREFSEEDSVTFYFFISTLFFLPFSFISFSKNIINLVSLFIAFFSSLISMVLGGVLYYKAIKRIGSGEAGVLTSLIPLFTFLTGSLLGLSMPSSLQIFGGFLSIIGTLILSRLG